MPSSLCQLASEALRPLPAFGAMVETKVDGWRCLLIPDHEGKPTLWTRNGVPLLGAGHILRRLVQVERALGGRWFIDGEIQVDGSLAATKAHCERGWRDGDRGTFHAFDAVPLSQWERDCCPTPLYRRKETLVEAIKATAPDPAAWEWEAGSRGRNHGVDPVVAMPEQWCADAADLAAYVGEIWRTGGEGVVVKDVESQYRRSRTPAWRKIKCPAQLRVAA